MGTVIKKDVPITFTLPIELHEAIQAKARLVSATFDQTLEVLLRTGLAAQDLRESEIEALAQRLASSDNAAETESFGNQLGQKIFGH